MPAPLHFHICRQDIKTHKTEARDAKMLKFTRILLLLAAVALLAATANAADGSRDGCVEDGLICKDSGVVLSRDPKLGCDFPACPSVPLKHAKAAKEEAATTYQDKIPSYTFRKGP